MEKTNDFRDKKQLEHLFSNKCSFYIAKEVRKNGKEEYWGIYHTRRRKRI